MSIDVMVQSGREPRGPETIMPIPLDDARHAIYEILRGRIVRGEEGYKPGQRIPTQPALAAEFDVAPITITRAVSDLRAEGLVRTYGRRGTYVIGSGT